MRVVCRMETGAGKLNIEDRALIGDTILAGGEYSIEVPDGKPFVLAVADGVGGHKAGDVAACTAVEGITAANLRGVDTEAALLARISEANARIIERSIQDPSLEKMATTLSGLFFTGTRWLLFHIGNTRVYLLERPYLNQLTTDHTWSAEMRLAGFSADEIKDSGRSSSITACIGNGNEKYAEKLRIIDVTSAVLNANGILLTSDGIHDFASQGALESEIGKDASAEELLQRCMKLAREAGSEDDLSVVYVSF